MDYSVLPGLYALGSPDPTSPVLVTSNYKLTFDHLRSTVASLDAWILVLDTDGVNVWCAAGKGTFGTDELIRQIQAAELGRVVEHRRLIVPQLGAPGVAGHEVARKSDFEVVWGPVRAEDILGFLAAGAEATPEMRRSRFPVRDRMTVIPIELVAALKFGFPLMAALMVLGGLTTRNGFLAGSLDLGLTGVLVLLVAIVAGAVVTPILLPWIPGRAFAVKGAAAGLPLVALTVWLRRPPVVTGSWPLEAGGWLLVGVAAAAFLAMNFTGASTFTSLSGVKKEMRVAVPAQLVAVTIGIGLLITSKWLVP